MSEKFLYIIFALTILSASILEAQVSTKTGSIYGQVIDERGTSFPGVVVFLESEIIPSQTVTTGSSGRFRFTNLPPGIYTATFQMKGFTEVRQEEINVRTGSSLELKIVMHPSPAEEVTVIGEPPPIDAGNNTNDTIYSSKYLKNVPIGHDPWFVLNMTTGIDSARFNTGAESGQQVVFVARGDQFQNNIWNYDGVNYTDGYGGGPNSYFDFDAFEEIQIITAANDASIQTGGIAVNIVSKRAGNKWTMNASYYYSGEALQSTNTPKELIKNPIFNPVTGSPAHGSDRIDSINDLGFDLGGPVVRDKFFLWGAFRKYFNNAFDIQDTLKKTEFTDYNSKCNFNWNSTSELQMGYFLNLKQVDQRPAFFNSTTQAPGTLWDQVDHSFGLWNAQYSWIPNNQFLLTARYGINGKNWALIPPGGKDVPVIYLSAIPHWENTFQILDPIEQNMHDITIDADYFTQNLLGRDHEFKFGFEYKYNSFRTFSSYGNGVLINDDHQTIPNGSLTEGFLAAQHYVDGRMTMNRGSFYVTDTIRSDRLTLNLGLRFDHQTGKNKASSVPGVPGFEQDVGRFIYEGGDPGITFNNISPRLGIIYDLTGDGKTVVRGNFARYYNSYDPRIVQFSNPTYVYNGAYYTYTNRNGDRVVTPDEITGGPYYYGGLNGGVFDLDEFLSTKHYSDQLSNPWTDEILAGFEKELMSNLTIGVNYIHRNYGNLLLGSPFTPYGVTTSDFVPAGTYRVDTVLGNFAVPYFTLGFEQDGSALIINNKDLRLAYDGIDITARKRMSRNFMLDGAVTFQNQNGHYNGGDSLGFVTTGVVAFDPTNLPFLEGRPYAYSASGNNSRINLFTNWDAKLAGMYQFPWNFATAVYLRYQQGSPFILLGVVEDPNLRAFYGPRHIIMVEPIGSRRMDNIFTIDLQIEKIFNLKEANLSVILSLFNLTNANTVLHRNNVLDEKNLNRIGAVLSPRVARIGITLSY
jgi:hypothetical protein